MRSLISAVISVIATALLLVASPQQDGRGASAPVQQGGADLNLAFEPIGPGDLIEIYVANYPEVSRSYRVSASGTIELPVLRKQIAVSGHTAPEVEKIIRGSLDEAKLLVDPVVSVSVLEYRSKPVTVVGAVRQPVSFQAIGGLRLLDAIAKANGLAPEAGPEIIISNAGLNGEPAYVHHISVKELMAQPESALNVYLNGGEEIRVPAAEKLYIVGNVKNPGAYPVDQTDGLTVLQALALCQGTLSFSQQTAVVYRPKTAGTGRQEIEVPLREIMKRHVADFHLQANDILYIPDSSGRRLTATVLDRIATFGSTTGSGVLIWGNR